MKSMTGFGKAELRAPVGKFSVEISSVNNRFLEISARLPRQFFALEARLRTLISAHIERGKIYLYVGYEESNDSAAKFAINRPAARAYHKQLMQLKKELGLSGGVEIHDLMLLPEFANPDKETIDDKLIWPPLEKATRKALNELISMRRKEGAALARDMRQRMKVINGYIKVIVDHSSDFVDSYREKLAARIQDLLQSPAPDSVRLEEEIVMVAERIDISEECIRLKSHVGQFTQTLAIPDPVGKKLNFILQEMNREANTIASKCSDIRISSAVISLKEEIEKLREQVQNVE
ncbi:MAG: YicC family protein [candidate division Zixibacteria bacterium]|nr:YicC family protein [candidate division Zixibacteria bacterium]